MGPDTSKKSWLHMKNLLEEFPEMQIVIFVILRSKYDLEVMDFAFCHTT